MVEQKYTGWKKWTPTAEEWVDFYTDKTLPFELNENEYLIIQTSDGNLYYCYENGKLRKFTGGSIKTYREKTEETQDSAKKKKYSKGRSTCIVPRNEEQVCAFDLMKDDTKTIKLLEGSFGTGKTMIMVNAALEALKLGKFERIIYIRNNVDCVGTKDLGALPGTQDEKMAPWVGPFVDYAGEDAVRTMLANKTLIIEPLQYIRGRNFENSIILCTEAENLLLTNIQLIIARAAEGTQVWFDGDYRQYDKRIFKDSDGLNIMKTAFTGNKLFGCVTLTKSERSETAAMADLLNEVVDEQKLKLLR